jgi:hypothetical protein
MKIAIAFLSLVVLSGCDHIPVIQYSISDTQKIYFLCEKWDDALQENKEHYHCNGRQVVQYKMKF